MHNINCERNKATWVALTLQVLWRSGMLLSRIGVLVLAAVFLRVWFLLFLGELWRWKQRVNLNADIASPSRQSQLLLFSVNRSI